MVEALSMFCVFLTRLSSEHTSPSPHEVTVGSRCIFIVIQSYILLAFCIVVTAPMVASRAVSLTSGVRGAKAVGERSNVNSAGLHGAS